MTSTNGGSVIAMPRRMRSAVYTRKSSEEGLDMEFNSLDAQREACEAYIASQRAEGWVTMAASPVERWSALRCSACSPISRLG
jgi:hypothetical protein